VTWRWYDRFRFPIVHFQIALRKTEFAINTQKGLLGHLYAALLRYRLQRLGVKLGFTIPPNVFGHGLSIAHWGTIVVNGDCRVGTHCRIHPGSCLGWHNGRGPRLGNCCYVGPGAKLFGDVVLAKPTRQATVC
jgi:serine O-acetyltransferase